MKKGQNYYSTGWCKEFIPILNQALNNVSELQEVFKTIVSLAKETVGVERCSLMLSENNHLVIKSASWNDYGPIFGVQIPIGQGIAGLAAKLREPVYSTVSGTNLKNQYVKENIRYNDKTFCSVPIIVNNRCLGVLNISNKYNDCPLTDEDLSTVQLLSSTAGLILYNSLLMSNLMHRNKRERRILNVLSIGIILLSQNGLIEYCNPEAENIMGNSALQKAAYNEVLPHSLVEIIDRFFLKNIDRLHQNSFLEEVDIKSSETIKPVQVGFSPLMDKNNALEALLLSIRDLKLSQDYDRLKKIDDMRVNFVSMISHELRTPLTCIKGAVPVLRSRLSDDGNSVNVKMLDIIERNSNQLTRLINNLLDISLIQKDSLSLNYEKFSPAELINDILEELQYLLEKKNITLRIEIDNLPPLFADRDKIRKAWYNIIENGIKFSPEKSILAINCVYVEKENALLLSVKDKGIGIASENFDKIFTLFWQEDNSRTREYGGTGIGLYTARNIIQAHKGKIWFEPNKTEGTTFYTKLYLE